MSNYWPSGLKINDTQSPREILAIAQEDWHTNSSGVLTLVLQEVASQKGNDMIIVHAKHVPSNRTATLFSVVHRPNRPYPATIQQREADLPDFLKKSYCQPGFGDGAVLVKQRRTVTNEWICDTPSEFRNKLEEAFNLGVVKSEILNLVAGFSDVSGDDERESIGADGEEELTMEPAENPVI